MSTDLGALGRSIKQLQHRHHRAMDTRLAQVGSTLAQWDALRAVEQNPGASAHVLALATFQSDQAFGTLANRLSAHGLIERTPGHGRRIEHALTDEGRRILAAGQPMAAGVVTESFATLSEAERAQLAALVTKVLESDLG